MISDVELRQIRDAGLIDDAKLTEISAFLATLRSGSPANADVQTSAPRFDLTHVLWYAGALIVMGAMGLFTNEAFNRMGGWALAGCGAAYLVVFLAAGHVLWHRPGLRVPAGLLIAVAVSMVPLIIYGVQDAQGLWGNGGRPGDYNDFFPYMKSSWIWMEIGTILAAAIAVWRYPFPFILLVAAIALWFLSMDLGLWFGRTAEGYNDWEIRRQVSIGVGVLMIVAAWATDIITDRRPDFSFWIHLFGVMTFWGALTATDSGTELDKFLYCLINIAMIGLSVFLNRRVYAVFGALGVATYLGYLAYNVFQDVILFSFALSAIGIGVIGLGLLLHRNRERLAALVEERMPAGLRWLRPGGGRLSA